VRGVVALLATPFLLLVMLAIGFLLKAPRKLPIHRQMMMFASIRVKSLAGATLGAIQSASLAVGLIGQGLALARGRLTKHAVKQVDRLLSNQGIDVDALRQTLGITLHMRLRSVRPNGATVSAQSSPGARQRWWRSASAAACSMDAPSSPSLPEVRNGTPAHRRLRPLRPPPRAAAHPLRPCHGHRP
jgi:hypothetical protein